MLRAPPLPFAVLTDSYKSNHYLQYPAVTAMVAYGEFRGPYEKDSTDTRMVFYGMRHLIENYIAVRWTVEDVARVEAFYATHSAGATPMSFPKELFLKFIAENDGYLPITIQALPEGTVVNARTPVYQLTATGEYARLATYLETLLTQVWYPTTVATLSRRARQLIADAFATSVDADSMFLLDSRLHDFGFRGCTSVEQSVIGGTAHLLNFNGTDTLAAAFHAQYVLNGGKPVGFSVPASEHSVMTSWPTEEEAMRHMISTFGGPGAVFSIVMDSYDYENALYNVLPKVAAQHLAKGGVMVLRPDSGDPVKCVLQALDACEKAFGVTVNSKGYKVINASGVLQGDGINIGTIKTILAAVLEAGYSAQCVCFGMGGGLLQKVNRDTMAFATKLSHIVTPDGAEVDIMKRPKTDGGKISFPGRLQVRRCPATGAPTAYPVLADGSSPADVDGVGPDLLEVVYDCGPVKDLAWPLFDEIKARVEKQWAEVPRKHSPISAALQTKIDNWRPYAHLEAKKDDEDDCKKCKE